MVRGGVPAASAERACHFAQIAWGRAFMEGSGVRYDPGYSCLDGAGGVVESGALTDEPHFAAAMAVVRSGSVPRAAVEALGAGSSEVQVTMKSLGRGSRPENLVSSPVMICLAHNPPRPEATRRAAPRAAKPWWRFW